MSTVYLLNVPFTLEFPRISNDFFFVDMFRQ